MDLFLRYSVMSRHAVVQRLISLGLPRKASLHYVYTIEQWLQHHGAEWTTKHLKGLKAQFMHFTATGNYSTDLPKPKGTVRYIFGLGLNALDYLNVYTAFINKGPATPSQCEKFYGSMTKETPLGRFTEVCNELADYAYTYFKPYRRAYRSGHNERVRLTDQFITDHQIRTVWRSETIHSWISNQKSSVLSRESSVVGSNSTELEHINVAMEELSPEFDFSTTISHHWSMEKELLRDSYLGAKSGEMDYSFFEDMPQFSGKISFIQEGGYKLRAVANPLKVIQAKLSRMGFGLYNVLAKIPEDFTYDHESGVKWIQQANRNRTKYSFDLSDATNNLPVTVQISILRALRVKEWERKLFLRVSKGEWSCPDGEHRSFTVGQPLGLFPSFAAFALMHHLIVQYCGFKVYGKRFFAYPKNEAGFVDSYESHPRFDHYAIIGDDIVIWDDLIALKYTQVMSDLGCPIDATKSLVSKTHAEFAKRFITPSDVKLPIKWSKISDMAIKPYLEKTGQAGLITLTPRQRRRIERFLPIPQPLGLGWNPKGLPRYLRTTEELDEYVRFGNVLKILGDELTPSTDLRLADLPNYRFEEDQVACCEPSRDPIRDPEPLRTFKALRRCGLPVLSNVADYLRNESICEWRGGLAFRHPFPSIQFRTLRWFLQNSPPALLDDEEDNPSGGCWPAERRIIALLQSKSRLSSRYH